MNKQTLRASDKRSNSFQSLESIGVKLWCFPPRWSSRSLDYRDNNCWLTTGIICSWVLATNASGVVFSTRRVRVWSRRMKYTRTRWRECGSQPAVHQCYGATEYTVVNRYAWRLDFLVKGSTVLFPCGKLLYLDENVHNPYQYSSFIRNKTYFDYLMQHFVP